MFDLKFPYRPASPDDAVALAELANIAGEGLPLYVWNLLAETGVSAWDVGRERARRDQGAFSYRNAILREEHGTVMACLIGYPLADEPAPVKYKEMPAMFVPLQQLEDETPGTWYVNVLAAYPGQRNKGYGSELLSIAEQMARDSNKHGLSIIVSDANNSARRLYKKDGYREYATRPMLKEKWRNPGENWVLLVKNV